MPGAGEKERAGQKAKLGFAPRGRLRAGAGDHLGGEAKLGLDAGDERPGGFGVLVRRGVGGSCGPGVGVDGADAVGGAQVGVEVV